jgi:hypothetical protein
MQLLKIPVLPPLPYKSLTKWSLTLQLYLHIIRQKPLLWPLLSRNQGPGPLADPLQSFSSVQKPFLEFTDSNSLLGPLVCSSWCMLHCIPSTSWIRSFVNYGLCLLSFNVSSLPFTAHQSVFRCSSHKFYFRRSNSCVVFCFCCRPI